MSSLNGSLEITTSSLDDLKSRFETYENGVRSSYLFVSNLVKHVEDLMNRGERLDKEVHGLLNTIRNLEKENTSLKDRLTKCENVTNKGRFAAVILDGEGIVFSKDFLNQGFDGGREAARQLVALSYKSLNLPQTTKIVVSVFANVCALANTLYLAGVIPKTDILNEFVNGFNCFDEMVTFINIGRIKDLIDSKIDGLTRMYASMPQCEHIILGGSQDIVYARLLSKLEAANVLPGKVVLLQTAPLAFELNCFDSPLIPRIKPGDLFIEKKLEGSKKYAQVAADGILQVTRKPPSPTRTSPVSPHKLVEPDLNVWLSVKNLSPRACNMYYLNPLRCSKSDCEYSHDHILTEIQLLALRFNCKKQLCRAFQISDTCPYGDDCIYGHECPDNIAGKCISGKKCRLSHPTGISI